MFNFKKKDGLGENWRTDFFFEASAILNSNITVICFAEYMQDTRIIPHLLPIYSRCAIAYI